MGYIITAIIQSTINDSDKKLSYQVYNTSNTAITTVSMSDLHSISIDSRINWDIGKDNGKDVVIPNKNLFKFKPSLCIDNKIIESNITIVGYDAKSHRILVLNSKGINLISYSEYLALRVVSHINNEKVTSIRRDQYIQLSDYIWYDTGDTFVRLHLTGKYKNKEVVYNKSEIVSVWPQTEKKEPRRKKTKQATIVDTTTDTSKSEEVKKEKTSTYVKTDDKPTTHDDSTIEELNRRILKQSEENDQLRDLLKSRDASIKSLQNRQREFNDSYIELSRQLKEVNERLRSTVEQLNNKQSEIERLESLVSQYKTKANKSDSSALSDKRINELELEKVALTQQIEDALEKATFEKQRRLAEVSQLNSDKRVLAHEIEDKSCLLLEAQSKLEQAEKAKSELAGMIDSLNSEIAELKQKIIDLNNKYTVAFDENLKASTTLSSIAKLDEVCSTYYKIICDAYPYDRITVPSDMISNLGVKIIEVIDASRDARIDLCRISKGNGHFTIALLHSKNECKTSVIQVLGQTDVEEKALKINPNTIKRNYNAWLRTTKFLRIEDTIQ